MATILAHLLHCTRQAGHRIRRTLPRNEDDDLVLRASAGEELREGMEAFLNKRPPNWQGK
jgi:hypothetical protein